MSDQERSDSDRVYRRVRQGIIEGEYAPGSRLVEQRVAEELGVSRTPVREAVRRLESEGLVVVERNRGAQVRPLSEAEIADLYAVRARLESLGAELAAERAEAADVLALRVAADRFETTVADVTADRHDVAATRRLDAANAAFHETLLTTSRHSRIRHLVAGAVDAPLVFQALHRFDRDELARSSLFHHLIADAVAAREPDRAGRLMTEHVLQGRDTLLRRVSDAGGLSTLFVEGA